MDKGNANIVSSSFDRISGSALSPSTQPLNNFRIINEGGNLVQGQINRISLTEVSMLYDTPTIVDYRNNQIVFRIHNINASGQWDVDASSYQLGYLINEGFYSGDELTTFLNGSVSWNGSVPMSNFLTWDFDPVSTTISVEANTTWDTSGYAVEFLADYNIQIGNLNRNLPTGFVTDTMSYPNAFWTIGFRNLWSRSTVAWPVAGQTTQLQPGIVSTNTPVAYFPSPNYYTLIFGSTYTGRYTDFVDIISTSLCQNQFVRDSTTAQAIHKRDVIARIYVCNDASISAPDPSSGTFFDGSRPFNIHRQFNPPKVMKWTVERSVDALDLSLFDMYGLPMPDRSYFESLLPPESPFNINPFAKCGGGDYAITLHVHEPGAEEQNANVGYRM